MTKVYGNFLILEWLKPIVEMNKILLLFVMKGVAPSDTTMRQIYLAAIPFIICSLLLVVLLVLFPNIALWLPSLGN